MTKNTRYTIKAAQPAAQAQPLAENVLSQLLAVLAAELVQPPLAESLQHKFQRRTTIRTIVIRRNRRIAIHQTSSLQPLAELKWSRQPFAEKHLSLVKVIPATAVVTTRIADSVDRVQPKKGNWVTAPVELLQHPVTVLGELLQHALPGCSCPGRRDGPRSHRRPTRTLRKHG